MAADVEEIVMPPPADPAEESWDFLPGEMTPVRVPASYLFGLAIVAGAMVLLPLIYICVILLVCWATYYYATHSTDIFFPVIGHYRRISLILGVLYMIPILAGLSLIGVLLSPFFRSGRRDGECVSLSHADNPLLFRFIGQLCQRMGAPIPSRIDADLSVGASAGFREGFRSMFGNDIVLTIGLPLAASMTCREFGCVIAHELGHFTQRIAMRLGYVINMTNRWLVYAVYARADEPVLLDTTPSSGFSLLYSIVSHIGLGITRGILWVLLVVGHSFSSFMSRQMEAHADACAIAIGGSDAFISTFQKLAVMEQCYQRSALEFRNRVTPKLPDDFPTYLAGLSAQCAGELQGKIIQQAAAAKTKWYESHPSHAARVAHAEAEKAPGLITENRPAKFLFGNFSELSVALTMAAYVRATGGRAIPEDRLFHVQPEADLVGDTAAEESSIRDYFHGLGSFLRPLSIDAGGRLLLGAGSDRQGLIAASKLKVESPEVPELCARLQAIDGQLVQTLQHLAQTQMSGPAAGDTETSAASQSDLENSLRALEAQERDCGAELEPFEKAAAQRLTLTLGLLRTPAVARSMPQAEALHEEVQGLTHILAKVTGAFPSLLQARREYIVLASLLNARSGGSLSAGGPAADSVAKVKELLAGVRDALGPVQYPFDPPERHRTLADYARTKEFDPDPAMLTCKDAAAHLQALVAVYYRLLARLVQIAKEVEAHS
jgi:hypothetical protein